MQEVQCKADTSYSTVWEIEHTDPKVRFEYYGKPVKSNDEILIKHSFTNVWLATDLDFPLATDDVGGCDYEVYCHSHQARNKTQNLIAEKEGRSTSDIPLRGQLE